MQHAPSCDSCRSTPYPSRRIVASSNSSVVGSAIVFLVRFVSPVFSIIRAAAVSPTDAIIVLPKAVAWNGSPTPKRGFNKTSPGASICSTRNTSSSRVSNIAMCVVAPICSESAFKMGRPASRSSVTCKVASPSRSKVPPRWYRLVCRSCSMYP